MKQILLVIFGLTALWDAFTTLIGTSTYLTPAGSERLILVPSFVALVILGFMVGSKRIWGQEGTVGVIFKVFWVIAFAYDVYTSYLGNLELIMGGNEEKMIFLLGITLLTSASSILVSLIFD